MKQKNTDTLKYKWILLMKTIYCISVYKIQVTSINQMTAKKLIKCWNKITTIFQLNSWIHYSKMNRSLACTMLAKISKLMEATWSIDMRKTLAQK